MSDRERWIVYPLLFFSLGIGMRGKLYPGHDLKVEELQTDKIVGLGKPGCDVVLSHEIFADRIVCGEIDVRGANHESLIRMGSMYSLVPNDPASHNPAAGHPAGAIEIYGKDGIAVISLRGQQEGVVQVHAPAPQRGIALTPSGTTSIPGQVVPGKGAGKVPALPNISAPNDAAK